MARYVLLDSGPLSLACSSPRKPGTVRFAAWMARIAGGGVRIVIPEVADYEVRRELLRVGATESLSRLDALRQAMIYDPITTPVMRLAAEYWATSRRAGLPTSDPHALDGDVILAAQASLMAGEGDSVIVATTNPRHLGRFIDARDWATIA